jgi:hypothetical protein
LSRPCYGHDILHVRPLNILSYPIPNDQLNVTDPPDHAGIASALGYSPLFPASGIYHNISRIGTARAVSDTLRARATVRQGCLPLYHLPVHLCGELTARTRTTSTNSTGQVPRRNFYESCHSTRDAQSLLRPARRATGTFSRSYGHFFPHHGQARHVGGLLDVGLDDSCDSDVKPQRLTAAARTDGPWTPEAIFAFVHSGANAFPLSYLPVL